KSNDSTYLDDTSKPEEIALRISNLDMKTSPVMRPELDETLRKLKDSPEKENVGKSNDNTYLDDTSKLDKIMLRISNLNMKLSTCSNDDSEKLLKAIQTIIQTLFKLVDDLFLEYFLNAGIWILPRSRDA
ncbi:28068_t:CDS:2, partial [Dentiscutata erythropus]